MKNSTIYFLALLLFCLQSCATLDKREIGNLNRVPFQDLWVEPGVEPTDLRIDVVRQQTQQIASANASTNVDVPYHPIGFEVGNGLFYDLNGNLSFRVSSLLAIDNPQQFSIQREVLARGKRGIEKYTLHDGEFQISLGHNDRVMDRFRLSGTSDSLTVEGRAVRDFSVIRTDTLVQYLRNNKVRNELIKAGDNHFILDRRLSRQEYQKKKNRVELGRHFILEITNDFQSIQVFRPALFGQRLVYTIQRSPTKILIFSPGWLGKKIEIGRNNFTVFKNNRPYDRYTLVAP